MDDGELTKELCEDVQDTIEQESEVIYDCCACNEAKYEVTFEGLWSRQTHPKDFPTNEWLTHFSDIIGASHSADYRVWEYGGFASDGLRQVAEWGSTQTLESELKRQSDHIRTIIKARGAWYPNVNGKTFAVFRVDNQHHLMSLVSMLGPTPDWIVGVSALELCQVNCSWVAQKTLNLYPWDAGTDSGVTYMSPNQATIPRERIRRITSSYPNNPESPFYDPSGTPMKPLARLTVTRQRVYEKSCSDKSHTYDEGPGYETSDEDADRPECAVSEWSLFTRCSATCGEGLRKRERTYILPMKAQMGGCNRQLEEKEVCAGEVDVCDGFHEFIDPKICMATEWSSWSHCAVTCGKGFMMRNRHYKNRMGRKKCALELNEKKICMAEIPECPQGADEVINPACTVTEWSDWSPCSVTCGPGISGRTRQFLIPSEDQKSCNVSLMDTRRCHADRADCKLDPAEAKVVCMQEQEPGPCRGYFPRYYYNASRGMCVQFIYGGCRGNKNNFKHYDECTRMCEFPGLLTAAPEQRAPAYADSQSNRPQPVDCMITPWSSWSPCSSTCGKGHYIKTRMVKVEPQFGGKHCPKRLFRRKKCRDNPRCSKSSKRKEESRSFPENLKLEILSLTGDVTPEEKQDTSGPHDCVMSEWGPWSPCTHSCGSEALQQRARSRIVPSHNNGKKCGARLERRYCSLPPCHHSRG
ncbi:spondin-1-like [Oratosquilla oratoria]|uniref:spondin-1-like n=1 Tax=Oratosquilla oratoria TaxID=337810 RepID=UPI003F75AEE5